MFDSQITDTQTKTSSFVPMTIIGLLFFLFGFITWLNGALIPYLQIVCELTEAQALFIAFAFYIAYVVMALPMSWVLDKTGYKNGMALGLGAIAFGCLLFIPAAFSQAFWVFLLAQFTVGTGLTILQTASNPYIVKIGPSETAAVRISIMGILNKFAGFLSPIIFTTMVLSDFSNVNVQYMESLPEFAKQEKIYILANALVTPYTYMALLLVILGMLLRFSSLPELTLPAREDDADNDKSVWAFPQLILGVITLFFYVGVEVIAGDTIGLFGSQLGVENATSLTSYTMAFMVFGYLCGLVLIPRFLSQAQALASSAIFGILISLCIVFADSQSSTISQLLWAWTGLPELPNSVALVATLGFANAMVWPAVWPLALEGLNRLTARGSALLIMGISGGAILPVCYGYFAQSFSSQSAYWMMIPCYGFILFYALKGHKLRAW